MHTKNWRVVSLVFLSLAGICLLMAGYSFGKAIYSQAKIERPDSNNAVTPRDFERQMKSIGDDMGAAFAAISSESRGLSYSVLCAVFMFVAIGCEIVARMDYVADRLSKAIAPQHQSHALALHRTPDPEQQLQEQIAAVQHLAPTPASSTSAITPTSGSSSAAQDKIKVRCGACGRVIVAGSDWTRRIAACPQCRSPVQFP
jgi:hypothetical protein